MLMRFLLFLRDRVVPYLFLLCIVVGGLGGIGWLLAQTYLWNTSRITFLVDEEIISAKIDISARIIYRDFPLFQSTYPVHITLPFSREITCTKECVFSDIPAGEARVTFVTKAGVQLNEQIVIAPDTQGIIDLRMPIRVREVPLSEVIKNPGDTAKTPIDPENIFYRNTVQGLWLFYDKGLFFLYDVVAQQSILLVNDGKIRSVARGIQDGTYYLITDTDEALLFDRYGRQKTEKVTHSLLKDQDLVWEQRDGNITTKLLFGGKERVFSGRLFWFEVDKKQYLFNGDKILEIINN